MNVLRYLLESGLCAATLWAGYHLLLRSTSRFTLCRAYLLLCMPLSLAIPALRLPLWPAAAAGPLWSVPDVPQGAVGVATPTLSPALMLGVVYTAGAAYFAFRFLRQLFLVYGLTYGAGASRRYHAFTFFRKIYVNKTAMSAGEYRQVLLHEQVHARQLHSVDLLLAELFAVAQWFNPFAWQLRRSLTEVHEYIADRQVLAQGANVQQYKELLFKQTVGLHPEYASGFNYSLIKKRLAMITKTKTNRFMALRLTGLSMATAALVAVFGCTRAGSESTGEGQKTTLHVTSLRTNSVGSSDSDTFVFRLKSGEVLTYAVGSEEERKAMELKVKDINPNDILRIDVLKGKVKKSSLRVEGRKDTTSATIHKFSKEKPGSIVITLKSGEVKIFATDDKDFEQQLNAIDVNDIESIDVRK